MLAGCKRSEPNTEETIGRPEIRNTERNRGNVTVWLKPYVA